MDEKVICVIPAKGYSERVKRKNIRLLAGVPLLTYTVRAALNSGVFSRVVVSTEDEEVKAVALEAGAEVPFLRPKELSDNAFGVADVVMNVLLELEQLDESKYDTVCVLLPTAPFREADFVRTAHKAFLDDTEAPVLMSVSELEYPPFWAMRVKDGRGERCFPEMAEKRRHDLEQTYKPDGVVMYADVDWLLKEKTFNSSTIHTILTPKEMALDIDTEQDLLVAEFMMNREEEFKNP